MSKLEIIRGKSNWGQILEGQLQHLGIVTLMSIGAISLLANPTDAPRLLGLTAYGWAITSISLAIVHQVIVAIVFRLQLHRNLLSRLFGDADMRIWAIVFLPLLASRPLTLIMTGWADTTPLTDVRWAELALGLALLAPALWAMHSTLFHFTIPRALGGDHFRDEIAALPMVKKGAFAYTNNAMYGVVFLGLWAIALLFGSWNALVTAAFHHAYIWVHMYTTEGPDMRRIYQNC
ncbi:MAG: hypothetical protein GY945_13760 [Rhodobacteraceae bacterium]|nr:hypothetical protein [Paracoccaceae bacterium]